MTGNEYQKAAMRTYDGKAKERMNEPIDLLNLQKEQKVFNIDIPGLINGALGLTGEAGEVSDLLKKGIFHGKGIDMLHLKEEIGDVCWYIALLCEAANFDLDEILAFNDNKLKERYPDGFDKNRAHL